MKLLADENLHGGIVAWLRAQGHDVLYAAEGLPGESDDDVLALAQREGRVVITDDKDFGELVFHRRLSSSGVLLVRLDTPDLASRLKRLAEAWPTVEAHGNGQFIVISDRKIRVRPIAGAP